MNKLIDGQNHESIETNLINIKIKIKFKSLLCKKLIDNKFDIYFSFRNDNEIKDIIIIRFKQNLNCNLFLIFRKFSKQKFKLNKKIIQNWPQIESFFKL